VQHADGEHLPEQRCPGQPIRAARRPLGRASTGEPQLRHDEAKRYRDATLRLFDQNHDRFALAAVIPLCLGMRAGEVLTRRVSDADADGRIHWIDRGKSKNARRHLSVKAEPLRTRLAQLAGGRHPEEPLFAVRDVARDPVPQSLRRAVRHVCKRLACPSSVRTPHSLRGLWATLSMEAGAAETAVATALCPHTRSPRGCPRSEGNQRSIGGAAGPLPPA